MTTYAVGQRVRVFKGNVCVGEGEIQAVMPDIEQVYVRYATAVMRWCDEDELEPAPDTAQTTLTQALEAFFAAFAVIETEATYPYAMSEREWVNRVAPLIHELRRVSLLQVANAEPDAAARRRVTR